MHVVRRLAVITMAMVAGACIAATAGTTNAPVKTPAAKKAAAKAGTTVSAKKPSPPSSTGTAASKASPSTDGARSAVTKAAVPVAQAKGGTAEPAAQAVKFALTTMTVPGNLYCRQPGTKTMKPAGSGLLEVNSGVSLRTSNHVADVMLPGGSFLSMDANTLVQVGLYENGIFVVQKTGRVWHRVKRGTHPEWFYTAQLPAMRVSAVGTEFSTSIKTTKTGFNPSMCQVEKGKTAVTIPLQTTVNERGREMLEAKVFPMLRCPMPPEVPPAKVKSPAWPGEQGLSSSNRAKRAAQRVLDTWGGVRKEVVRECGAGQQVKASPKLYQARLVNTQDGVATEIRMVRQQTEGAPEFPLRVEAASVDLKDPWVSRNRRLSAELAELDRLLAKKQIDDHEYRGRLFDVLHSGAGAPVTGKTVPGKR